MTVTELDPLPPGPGHVQIAVAYNGICGTDLHIVHGHMDSRVDVPAIIGHEMSGTIAAVGDGVEGWAVGDPVTVMPLAWDGTCPACLAGNRHICHNLDFVGIDSPGALQGRWNVDAALLVPLPRTLDLKHAALVEPTAVAVHDVRRAGLARGDKAVVIGGGPIGVLIASVARSEGADVTVIELDDRRRSAVAGLGFTALDPRDDTVAQVERWTGGAGADVVFEVSGAAAAVLGAVDYAKVRGTLVVVAIHPEPRPVNLQRVFWRELSILGARVYERRDFDAAVALLDAGEIPADALITATVPLTEIQSAFDSLVSGEAMKILVDVQAGQEQP
ncbi:alcohol dehydrogenase catalytic domain-containing protein [Glycomyces scopariae]